MVKWLSWTLRLLCKPFGWATTGIKDQSIFTLGIKLGAYHNLLFVNDFLWDGSAIVLT